MSGVWPHTLLTALAARVLNRPVRIQLTRAQMCSMVGHQAATIQTIALGADRDGKLTGIRRESISATSFIVSRLHNAQRRHAMAWTYAACHQLATRATKCGSAFASGSHSRGNDRRAFIRVDIPTARRV